MLYLVEEEADSCVFYLRWELVGFCEYLVDIFEYLAAEADISLLDLRSEFGG